MSAVDDRSRERVELALEGMTCASCAARIERKLNRLRGVQATVNFATGRAAVSFDPERADIEALIAALALTVPLALLAMLPALHFSGWRWVALVLATPAVFWGGWQFHRAALANAGHLMATMDTLISLGTLAAWGWSTVVL